MKYLKKYNLFENLQKAEKIIKDKHIRKDGFVEELISTFQKEGLESYLGFLFEITGEYIDQTEEVDELVEIFKKVKSQRIDLTKRKFNDYYQFIRYVDDMEVKNTLVQFVNRWCPSSIRKEAKSILDDNTKLDTYKFLRSYPYYPMIQSLSNLDKEALKKGSRCKTAEEWYNFVKICLSEHDIRCVDELKQSNIKVYYEDDTYLIYKPLDYKTHMIQKFKHWCTMTEKFYNYYMKLDMIIYLNKVDIEKSYISFVNKWGEFEAFTYGNHPLRKIENEYLIMGRDKFHEKKPSEKNESFTFNDFIPKESSDPFDYQYDDITDIIKDRLAELDDRGLSIIVDYYWNSVSVIINHPTGRFFMYEILDDIISLISHMDNEWSLDVKLKHDPGRNRYNKLHKIIGKTYIEQLGYLSSMPFSGICLEFHKRKKPKDRQ